MAFHEKWSPFETSLHWTFEELHLCKSALHSEPVVGFTSGESWNRNSFTSADVQLLHQLQVGTKTVLLYIGDKDKLLQCGGALLLLPAWRHGGVQTGDVNSSGNNAVETSRDGHVHSWGEVTKERILRPEPGRLHTCYLLHKVWKRIHFPKSNFLYWNLIVDINTQKDELSWTSTVFRDQHTGLF